VVLHGSGDGAPKLIEAMQEETPMSTTKPSSKPDGKQQDKERGPEAPADEEPGSNAVQHEPDPKAEPIPDGEHKYIRRSPYTTGNY
jgi:hypothetical protein